MSTTTTTTVDRWASSVRTSEIAGGSAEQVLGGEFGEGRRGVRGTISADGIQKYTVRHYEDPVKSKLTINKTKGKTVELCAKLGLRAVAGKNLPG